MIKKDAEPNHSIRVDGKNIEPIAAAGDTSLLNKSNLELMSQIAQLLTDRGAEAEPLIGQVDGNFFVLTPFKDS